MGACAENDCARWCDTVSGTVGESHAAKAVALAPLPVTLVLFTRGVREGPLAVHLALFNLAAVDIALQERIQLQDDVWQNPGGW